MGEYELIDHTADIGIKLKAKDLSSLFVNSAAAMFDVIAKKKTKKFLKGKNFEIHLKEESLDELFMAWLRELLSLADCEDVIFTKFAVEHLAETEIKALVTGLKRSHFHIIREIKAVTYHDLKIGRVDGIFRAEVIFDV